MALPIGDIQEVVQPLRQYWNEPIQKLTNQNFKIFKFIPIFTVPFNDLDCAMAALSNDVTDTIDAQCREWHGVKVWPILFVRYESANPLDEHFKTFDVLTCQFLIQYFFTINRSFTRTESTLICLD